MLLKLSLTERALANHADNADSGFAGVSVNTRAGRVTVCVRQEGSPIQHNSVARVGSNF